MTKQGCHGMEWRQVTLEWADELTCIYLDVALYIMCLFLSSVNGTFHRCYRNTSIALFLCINVNMTDQSMVFLLTIRQFYYLFL